MITSHSDLKLTFNRMIPSPLDENPLVALVSGGGLTPSEEGIRSIDGEEDLNRLYDPIRPPRPVNTRQDSQPTCYARPSSVLPMRSDVSDPS